MICGSSSDLVFFCVFFFFVCLFVLNPVRVYLCVSSSSALSFRPSFVGMFAAVCRPDSAGGFSSCPSTGSRNGEKDWENDSTTSSTPSNTEYTGIFNTAFGLTETW